MICLSAYSVPLRFLRTVNQRIAATFLACSLATSAAAAEVRDAAAAEELFQRARAAVAAGDHAEACRQFRESYRLEPSVGAILNIAICEEKLGELASSWQHYEEALQKLAAGDERIEIAREGAQRVKKLVPRLTIRLARSAPPGSRVERDGVELAGASLGIPLPVDPGTHTITTTAPGRRAMSIQVTLKAGTRKEIVVAPGEQEVPAAQPSNAAQGTVHQGGVDVQLESTPPGLTFYVETSKAIDRVRGGAIVVGPTGGILPGFFGGRVTRRNYSPLCAAPCSTTLAQGQHHLALSLHGETLQPVDPIQISEASTLNAQWVDNRHRRIAAWVVLGVGLAGSAGLLFVAQDEECIGSSTCYDTISNTGYGLSVAGLALTATAFGLTFRKDKISITVTPASSSPTARSRRGSVDVSRTTTRTWGGKLNGSF